MNWITDDSIDLAVLRLFRDQGGCRFGKRILYAQLERRWRSTGLRQNDLAQAIQRLERGCYLRVIHDVTPGPDVELALPGYRRLVPVLLSGGEWMNVLSAALQLLRLHWRRACRSTRRAARRHDDPV